MICIRCRRASKGNRCAYCSPKEAPARKTAAVAKRPAAPTKGYFTPRNIIGLVVLGAALLVGGFIRLMRDTDKPEPSPSPAAARTSASPRVSPRPSASPSATPSVDDSRTAKQKRFAGLFRELMALQESTNPTSAMRARMADLEKETRQLVLEACGNDESKEEEFFKESLAKHAPDLWEQMSRDPLEALAATNLRSIQMAQIKILRLDPAAGLAGFWVADVMGLAVMIPKHAGGTIDLISRSIAAADANPVMCSKTMGEYKAKDGTAYRFGPIGSSGPCQGYRFQIVPSYTDPGGKVLPYDSGNGCNKDRFAVCAFPAEYGKPGRKTFLMTETGAVLSKDTGGKPVAAVPRDLAADGWK